MKRFYHILLVEDEADIRISIQRRLQQEGYLVAAAGAIAEAQRLLRQDPPDLLVLDIMLPDGSGLDFCRDLRGITTAPVLFLTSLGEKSQVVRGLRVGGDDYIVKPFDQEELVARIEALLRRVELLGIRTEVVVDGPLTFEPLEQRAYWNGTDLVLSPKEFHVLQLLYQNRNRYSSAQELYSMVWGMSAGQDVRTVAVHISGLRRKLQNVAGEQIQIPFLKERGYRLLLQEVEK